MLLAAVLGCVLGNVENAGAQSPVQRGEYLVNLLACNDCHTPMGPGGQPMTAFKLAGHPPDAPVATYQEGPFGSFALTNTSWAGPWGVSFSRNLTPDPDTDLGKWTEADFIKAIRTGHRPNDTVMLPPMPWPAYAHATDEDLKAVWAYLRSLTPIKNAVPANIPPK
jgi:cytochrome c553